MAPPPAPPGLPAPADVAAPVVVYTTRWCGYCHAALALLRDRDIEHVEIDVSGNHDARRWMREVTRQSTVPQVFVGGRSIGGYTELAALDRSGELDRMLASL
ncbi:MAG: glutaredoxin [Myxococcales bacterium]|nr:glutaredoxin [Myxococcales bacterium]